MDKILIIEDDKGISLSLKIYLENSDFFVEVLNTGENAVEKILENKFDLVILDINLPVMNGIEICKKTREKSNIPIIMLTARTSEMDKIKGLEIGADDYIEKPFSPRELLARINVILRRIKSNKEEKNKKSNIISFKNIKIDDDKRIVKIDNKQVDFTKNEYDILVKIIKEDGKVVSRETLMVDVIGYDQYVYDRTLDTHIKNLRKKVGKDIILTVRGEGYRLNK